VAYLLIPIFEMKEFAKTLALRFGRKYIEIDKLSLQKNKGLIYNPPSNNAVYDGFILSHKLDDSAVKIYIKCSQESLARKIMEFNKVEFEEALQIVNNAEKQESEYLKKYYDIDVKDLSIYDLVIFSDKNWIMMV
jgi:cytidylate kinase